jgi:hypothetical protein
MFVEKRSVIMDEEKSDARGCWVWSCDLKR